jgi:[ribosomal protein S18]-alanine N-acetyltransferase
MLAADIDSVLALEQQIAAAPHWNRGAYECCVDAGDAQTLRRTGFVAVADGRLLGFSIGKLVAGVGELESVAVEENMRGQGIGRALLSAVVDWAKSNGAERVELEVRASNSGAIRLYAQAGLRREGIRAGYYDDPEEDAVLMGISFSSGGNLA